MKLSDWLKMLHELIESHSGIIECARGSSIIHYETKLARIEGKVDIILMVIKTILGR